MPMKVRDVRELCDGIVHPNVRKVLEAIVEEQHTTKAQLAVVGATLEQMTDIIGHMVTVGDNMKNVIKRLNGEEMVHEDLGSTTPQE